MSSKDAQGITAEQFQATLAQLSARREAKKQRIQRAADDLALHLARERIGRKRGEVNHEA